MKREGKKTKIIKSVLHGTGCFAVAALISWGAFLPGLSFSRGGVWHAFAWIAFTSWLIFYAGGQIRSESYKKQVAKGMAFEELFEAGFCREKIIGEDAAGAGADFRKRKRALYEYLMANFLLIVIFCSFAGLAAKGGIKELYFLFPAIGNLFLWCAADFFFRPGKKGIELRDELSEREYPESFSLARKAVSEAYIRKSVRIFLAGAFWAEEKENEIRFYINAPPMALMTENEVKILFARLLLCVRSEDEKKARKAELFLSKLYAESLTIGFPLALSLRNYVCFGFRLSGKAYFACRTYLEILRRNVFRVAGAELQKKGHGQVCAEALAKIELLKLYEEEAGTWTGDLPPLDEISLEKRYAAFDSDFALRQEKNGGLWERWLLGCLEDDVAGRLTYAGKRKLLGVSAFDVSKGAEPRLAEELKSAWKTNEKVRLELLAARYGISNAGTASGESETLQRADIWMDEVVRAGGCSAELAEEFILLEGDLFGIENETALRLAETFLRFRPRDDYALFYKGLLLLRKGDPEGVKTLYRAMEISPLYSADAICRIGEFSVREGRADLLAECLSLRDEFFSRYGGASDDLVLRPRDKLSPLRLPGEEEERLAEGLIVALREKKDFVRKIYAAKKSSKSGYDVYYFGFCFQKKAPYQVRFEILEIAERYLKISGFFQSDALFNVFEGGDSEKLKKLKKDVFSCKIYDADDEYLPSAVD